jgi:hypothetical protein
MQAGCTQTSGDVSQVAFWVDDALKASESGRPAAFKENSETSVNRDEES